MAKDISQPRPRAYKSRGERMTEKLHRSVAERRRASAQEARAAEARRATIPLSPNAERVRNAAQTKRDVAKGSLPGSWLTDKERALRSNPRAAILSERVANKMLADPNAAASKLEAVQRGAARAAKINAVKTGGKVALAVSLGAAALTALAAMTSKAKAAEPANPAKPSGDTYERKYTTGAKAGQTETVRKRGRAHD